MAEFLKNKSYDIVKLFINQLAIAIFGLSLALATGGTTEEGQTNVLQIVTGVFSVAFYLFLVYTMMWDAGYKDGKHIKNKEEGYSSLCGLFVGLCASLLNFLVAVFITLGTLFPDSLSGVGGVFSVIGLIIEGMYTGLLAIRVGDIPLNTMPVMWFLIMVPMILTSTVAYIAGTKELRVFKTKQKPQ